MRLINYLNEALTLSQARMFKKYILSGKYKKYLDHVFKGEDRIYLPLGGDTTNVKIPSDIMDFIKKNGYEIVDYKRGLVKKANDHRLAKLGKLISKSGDFELLKVFQNDKNRTAGKKSNLLVVISRHPYDIAGMSTGRGWQSCMTLPGDPNFEEFKKGNKRYYGHISYDIEEGSIIAYVIDPEDKNINRPLGRLMIKPFVNLTDESDVVLYPEGKVYGADVKGFRQTVFDWLKSWQKKYKGTYSIKPSLYDDDVPNYIGTGDKNNEDPEVRMLYYQNNPEDEDAKKDKNDNIRMFYYKNHPKDEDAKKDRSVKIRKMYYNIKGNN